MGHRTDTATTTARLRHLLHQVKTIADLHHLQVTTTTALHRHLSTTTMGLRHHQNTLSPAHPSRATHLHLAPKSLLACHPTMAITPQGDAEDAAAVAAVGEVAVAKDRMAFPWAQAPHHS